MNEQNLIHPSPSEARENGRKGGIISGQRRLAKKRGRELVQLMLALPEIDERIISEMEKMGLPRKVSKEVAMNARQIDKAIKKADTNAYLAVLKAAGYDKTDVVLDFSDEQPPVIVFGNNGTPQDGK